MTFEAIFPPIETVLEMEPEELAPFVLKYLAGQPNINRYNFTLGNSPEFVKYAGPHREALRHRLMEAWMWLEKELFVMPQPGQQNDWAVITRRGRKILESQDFESYQKEALLRSGTLDPILVRKVKTAYIRGDYDSAIFEAFKEVEVRVRAKAGLGATDIGVALMRKAFSRRRGP